jgi:CRP-like cAMP-binding protein
LIPIKVGAVCRVHFGELREVEALRNCGKAMKRKSTIDDFSRRSGRGPSISAVPFNELSHGKTVHLLSERERAQLAVIASLVRFKKGEQIYGEGNRAEYLYNIIGGVAKTFRSFPDGRKRIMAFLFSDDLVGLAEEGLYVNSAVAVAPVIAYRLPLAGLDHLLRNDPTLEYHLIVKLCHELREAQHHLFVLGRHGALSKVALFIHILERHQESRQENLGEIYVPMSRSDIADYTGMSLEAVSRSFRTLATHRILAFRDRRHVRILDRDRFDGLVSGEGRPHETALP